MPTTPLTAKLTIAILQLIDVVLTVYFWMILIRALLSWVNPDPRNKAAMILNRMTEPLLQPIRRLIPRHNLPVDFAPMALMLAIIVIQSAVIRPLIQWAGGQ